MLSELYRKHKDICVGVLFIIFMFGVAFLFLQLQERYYKQQVENTITDFKIGDVTFGDEAIESEPLELFIVEVEEKIDDEYELMNNFWLSSEAQRLNL